MVTESQLTEMVKEAKEKGKKRNFNEAVELYIVFRDIDVKKGFQINETVQLPRPTATPAKVCVMASGNMGTQAKKADADHVISSDEINELGNKKRESRKFINKYDFFLADTQVMPIVGKILGQLLGPRGKMPTPVPYNAPIESFIQRFKSSIKVRVRASLSLSCKIGDVSMNDEDLAHNALAVINTVEKKLPSGDKNIKKIMLKTTMGPIIKEIQAKKK